MITFTTGTELTTAVTDLINAVLALLLLLRCHRMADSNRLRHLGWQLLLICICLSSLLGTVIHGIDISAQACAKAWPPLVLIMYITAASLLFCIYSEAEFRSRLPLAIMAAALLFGLLMVIFFCVNDATYWRLKIFFIFAAFCLVLSAIRCLQLWRSGRHGMLMIIAAMAIQIIGGVCQALHFTHFTFIWEFNHNAIAHFCISISLLLFYIGYRRLLTDGQLQSNSGLQH